MRPSPPTPNSPFTAGLDGTGVPPGASLRDIPTIDPDPRGSSPANIPYVMVQDDLAQAIEGTVKDSGTRIGEGLPPVPAKLAQRIIKGEFIELHELLPELMSEPKDTTKGMSALGLQTGFNPDSIHFDPVHTTHVRLLNRIESRFTRSTYRGRFNWIRTGFVAAQPTIM